MAEMHIHNNVLYLTNGNHFFDVPGMFAVDLKKLESIKLANKERFAKLIYKKQGGYIIIDDYENPLGLGNVNLNAGECFE